MQYFRVVQKILSFGPTYLVYSEGSETPFMTVRGKLFTLSPKLEAKEGETQEGRLLATVKGNFFKTKFDLHNNVDGAHLSSLQFPFISFLRNFTIKIGEKSYKTRLGFISEKFSCKDESGKELFTVIKEVAFRDQFSILVDDTVQKEIAILSAIVIDQKFFENKKQVSFSGNIKL